MQIRSLEFAKFSQPPSVQMRVLKHGKVLYYSFLENSSFYNRGDIDLLKHTYRPMRVCVLFYTVEALVSDHLGNSKKWS